MIASATLPISVDCPKDFHVPDAALEAIAMLLVEAAEAETAETSPMGDASTDA